MKRTTYILIGLFISGLVVIVIGIITISLIGEDDTRDISLEGEKTEMDLRGVHTVKVFINQGETDKRFFTTGRVEVTSSPVGKGKISYPKNGCCNVSQKKDTLLIELDLRGYATSEKYKNNRYLFVNDLDIKLAMDSTLKCIVTDVNSVVLNLKDIKADSLFVRAYWQNVELDSCQFRSFNLGGTGCSFNAMDSKIKNFYLDMNRIGGWTFENTEVDTEYLYGSGQHTNNLGKGECRRVIWNPLNKEATLQITLHEGAEVNVTP